jgi:hypothetical protein
MFSLHEELRCWLRPTEVSIFFFPPCDRRFVFVFLLVTISNQFILCDFYQNAQGQAIVGNNQQTF